MPRMRLTRLVWMRSILVGLLSLAAVPAASGDDAGTPRSEAMSLEDRLVAGLRARRPEDVAFLERVTALVDEGKLPEKLVTSTLAWAQRRGRTHPLPSFRRALQFQADHLGVSLED